MNIDFGEKLVLKILSLDSLTDTFKNMDEVSKQGSIDR
jgi:hypothetical protein